MTSIVISPYGVADYPGGGGHLWAYLQYALGFRRLGCQVHWLESLASTGDQSEDERRVRGLARALAPFELGGRVIAFTGPTRRGDLPQRDYIGTDHGEAEAVFGGADLLLNFNYHLHPQLLARFRKTALVDIDPGLLQHWITERQVRISAHDVYFTISEAVAAGSNRIPNCGIPWQHMPRAVSLHHWPHVEADDGAPFTTISSWWGGEWVTSGDDFYDNNKRASFLQFIDLPASLERRLELALLLSKRDNDKADQALLKRHGWHIRDAREVARTPATYRSYIARSRGEFSCAKPSCMKFRNGWISDRSLCYLASGKPVVVQDTGPCSYLPAGEGLLRFSTLDEAAAALAEVDSRYELHQRAAREIAETYFDATQTAAAILNAAL